MTVHAIESKGNTNSADIVFTFDMDGVADYTEIPTTEEPVTIIDGNSWTAPEIDLFKSGRYYQYTFELRAKDRGLSSRAQIESHLDEKYTAERTRVIEENKREHKDARESTRDFAGTWS